MKKRKRWVVSGELPVFVSILFFIGNKTSIRTMEGFPLMVELLSISFNTTLSLPQWLLPTYQLYMSLYESSTATSRALIRLGFSQKCTKKIHIGGRDLTFCRHDHALNIQRNSKMIHLSIRWATRLWACQRCIEEGVTEPKESKGDFLIVSTLIDSDECCHVECIAQYLDKWPEKDPRTQPILYIALV